MKEALVHVTRPDQAEQMRVIRNSCREFMTNDRHEITPEEQQAWFDSIHDSHLVWPFLYKPRPTARYPEPFGYGLIRRLGDKWWLSGGLLPAWRGKGYGTDLFCELAHFVHDQLEDTAYLTVWEHNLVAIATYKKIGFVFDAMIVDAYSPPIMVMSLPRTISLRMHKLTCPLCGIVTNRTRGPTSPTGAVAEHGDCLGRGATAKWEPEEVQ